MAHNVAQSPQILGIGPERLPLKLDVPRTPDPIKIRGVRFPDSPYPALNVASVPQRSPLRYPGRQDMADTACGGVAEPA